VLLQALLGLSPVDAVALHHRLALGALLGSRAVLGVRVEALPGRILVPLGQVCAGLGGVSLGGGSGAGLLAEPLGLLLGEPLLLGLDGLLRLDLEAVGVVLEERVVTVAARGLGYSGDSLAAGGEGDGLEAERLGDLRDFLGRDEVVLGALDDELLCGRRRGPEVVRGVLEGDCGLMLAVGDLAQAGDLGVCDPGVAALALDGEDAVGCLGWALSEGDGGDGGALGDDFFGLERLGGAFPGCIDLADDVDCEEVLGRLLGCDTTAYC
jgi:hypothetical protein